MEKLKPIGGIYTQASSAFQRGVYEDNARCLKANIHDDGVVMEVMGICDDQGRINKPLDIKDTVPTMRSETHGNIPKVTYDVSVEVKEATKKGYSVCRGGGEIPSTSRCREARQDEGESGVDMANTLDTSCNQGIFVQISENLTVYAVWYPKKQCCIAIRKLTPKECFRLQAWDDVYFERAQFVNSDSQLCKQAGNGVTVSVIKAIGQKMKKGGNA